MRRLLTVMGLFAMVASCGFDPKPKDGKLPCDNGCPSGYVCGAGNRCWLTNAPTVDSGIDGAVMGKDAASSESGAVDGAGSVDGASLEAGREASVDSSAGVDLGLPIDLAQVDTGVTVDSASIDGVGGSTIDAPMGAGGVSGNGGASGSGGASGNGGVSGSGGAVGTGGTSGTGGTGGSNADAASDAPLSNPDAACVPETDLQMCTRLEKNCDPFSGTDNCGQARSITSCGACQDSLVCGTFVANVCPTICVLDQSSLDQCVLE
jgi:hypothetical protein